MSGTPLHYGLTRRWMKVRGAGSVLYTPCTETSMEIAHNGTVIATLHVTGEYTLIGEAGVDIRIRSKTYATGEKEVSEDGCVMWGKFNFYDVD